MPITQCLEYNTYNIMYIIQEYDAYNTMHILQYIENNVLNTLHRIQCKEYNE